MKKVFVIIGMLALSVASFGQSTYEKTMTAHIDSLYRTLKMGTVQKTIESIKHVFASEPNRWEALYYISYAYCKLSLTEKNDSKKDDLCDSSQLYLDKAMKCSPNNSELYVLQGFVYNTRLIVSPMMRFYQYLGQINMAYDMAEKLDSLNPRPNYMRAMLILNSPTMAGGGKEKALPEFRKAKQKYDTFTSSNILCPRWGKEECEQKIAVCLK